MKVAYLDLSNVLFEDYALQAKRYGGGRAISAYLKQFSWYDIFADERCFDSYKLRDRIGSKKIFPKDKRDAAMNGAPLIDLLPELAEYDIIFHSHTNINFNMAGLKAKQVVWSVGYAETIHPEQKHLFLYNNYQAPKLHSPNTKIYYFTLGKEMPNFIEREKDNFIFQCSRHEAIFGSLEVANICRQIGVKAYFAGPISEGYPLLQAIDNKNTFYLGIIDDETKMYYTSKARLYSLIHMWNTPMSLSALEALSVGTPILTSAVGFWPSLIRDGVNGFFANTADDIIRAWTRSEFIRQSDCYSSVAPYNHHAMISSIIFNFDRILNT